MTDDSIKIKVLRVFRPFLRILMVYHPKYYSTASPCHIFRRICQIIAFSLLLIGNCFFTVGDAWFCINQQFNLVIIAQPLSFWLATVQAQATYVAIIPISERFKNVVDFLQTVIEKRELDSYSLGFNKEYLRIK